jgi:transcription elongation GreA/GreB family factor
MSRAFVKDLDEAQGEQLPELAISPHRNLVTRSGLEQIESTLRRIDRELAEARAADDQPTIARAERDRRYWSQRRSTAEVAPTVDRPETVRFGSTVELETDDGARLTFRIVGEDESDPANGLVSYVSPVAVSLMGARRGDTITFRGAEAEIMRID